MFAAMADQKYASVTKKKYLEANLTFAYFSLMRIPMTALIALTCQSVRADVSVLHSPE